MFFSFSVSVFRCVCVFIRSLRVCVCFKVLVFVCQRVCVFVCVCWFLAGCVPVFSVRVYVCL